MSGYVKPGSVPASAEAAAISSPLKLFGHAKNCISDIFGEIYGYINDSNTCISEACAFEPTLLATDQRDRLESYVKKTAGVLEMLRRDRMKVVFFGRTSNGKSTVINAMLKSKILPSGLGHTTNCFVQVEGTDSNEAFIVSDDNPTEKLSVQSVSQMTHALSKVKLDPDSLVRICWPKSSCRLLKEDVVLVDSPGIDMSPNMDKWIDKFCLDADVFVLVVNAESTLMQTEKNFFHRVSTRLSKPNVFILNNRWDASVNEPETMHEVRQQHLERDVEFLSSELHVMDSHEAEDNVFFVSALETLRACGADSRCSTPITPTVEGYQARQFEFASFEKKFEECISHTALETKFAQHTANGVQIISDVQTVWEDVCMTCNIKRCEVQEIYEEMKQRVDYTESQLVTITQDIREEIASAVQELEEKMTSVLTDEIRRLYGILEEFDRPFDPSDPYALSLYKKELHYHVEECLSRNLHVRCSAFVCQVISSTVQQMQEKLLILLPESSHEPASLKRLQSRSDFDMTYHLDCPGLCADFQEDIEFHFSLGLDSLVARFLRRNKGAGGGGLRDLATHIARPLSTAEDGESKTGRLSSSQGAQPDVIMTCVSAFTSVYSSTTVGTLAIITLVGKAIGWKLIAGGATIYGMFYIYERLSWTTRAKEEAFRRQYIDYVGSRLGMVIHITSTNCSDQVQRELNSALSEICLEVEESKTEMQTTLKKHLETKHRLDVLISTAKLFKTKAESISLHLTTFMHQFLKPSSRL